MRSKRERERERERERAVIWSEKELTSNLSVVVVVVVFCSEIWSKVVGERSFLTMMIMVKRRLAQNWENLRIEEEAI